MNRLLPVSEVARLLGVNRNFVYKLIKEWRCTYKSVENVARVA